MNKLAVFAVLFTTLLLSSLVEGQTTQNLECFSGTARVSEGRVIQSSISSGECSSSTDICYRELSSATVDGITGKKNN